MTKVDQKARKRPLAPGIPFSCNRGASFQYLSKSSVGDAHIVQQQSAHLNPIAEGTVSLSAHINTPRRKKGVRSCAGVPPAEITIPKICKEEGVRCDPEGTCIWDTRTYDEDEDL